MSERIWEMERGEGPLVATAIHDGHAVRKEVLRLMAISEPDRLREEDPFTGAWTDIAPTRIVATRSRFEVDLNRPREQAVYRTPADAWGLHVWNDSIPESVLARSIQEYDAFYTSLKQLYTEMTARYRRFVVFDLHTYNHRREGSGGPVADPELNPQINVGTGTMTERARWAPVIDRFISDLVAFDFPGGHLDVRENVKFRGGNHAAWSHATFPDSACVFAVEVKKFFMDEWTGVPDPALHAAVKQALAATVTGIIEELERL